MMQVVAAILEQDGRILIGQRTPQQSHPLKWEFPGGKVETAETPEQAVVRELSEELGIHAEGLQEIVRYPYTYSGKKPIELIFFRIGRYAGEISNRIFHDLRWVGRGQIGTFDFVEGDRDFLQGIARGVY
jgi:8-oxo-dGTP diphosphatase